MIVSEVFMLQYGDTAFHGAAVGGGSRSSEGIGQLWSSSGHQKQGMINFSIIVGSL